LEAEVASLRTTLTQLEARLEAALSTAESRAVHMIAE
jgi:hypothetical protein